MVWGGGAPYDDWLSPGAAPPVMCLLCARAITMHRRHTEYPACGCHLNGTACFNQTRGGCNSTPKGSFGFMGYTLRTAEWRCERAPPPPPAPPSTCCALHRTAGCMHARMAPCSSPTGAPSSHSCCDAAHRCLTRRHRLAPLEWLDADARLGGGLCRGVVSDWISSYRAVRPQLDHWSEVACCLQHTLPHALLYCAPVHQIQPHRR
jgi:hypothetical protein